MRLYILFPFNFKRNLYCQKLASAGFEVVDGANMTMRERVLLMLGCDGIATLTDWDTSAIHKDEMRIALICDMQVHRAQWWINTGVPASSPG